MRWPATVVGYVADVKVGGIETVNCHAHDPHDRDTHIDLAVSAGDANDEAKHVVVEVTPLPASHRLSSFPGAINHRGAEDITGGYIVIDPERLRGPVQQIADRILELVAPPPHLVRAA